MKLKIDKIKTFTKLLVCIYTSFSSKNDVKHQVNHFYRHPQSLRCAFTVISEIIYKNEPTNASPTTRGFAVYTLNYLHQLFIIYLLYASVIYNIWQNVRNIGGYRSFDLPDGFLGGGRGRFKSFSNFTYNNVITITTVYCNVLVNSVHRC